MRLAAFLLVAAGCGFSTQGSPIDTPPPIDVIDTPMGTWTMDSLSGKSTPATPDEWSSFITSKGLVIAPPDGLWPMQDAASAVADLAGDVDLTPFGGAFQQSVTGWGRRAIRTNDGSADRFQNNTSTALPDVSSTSLSILILFQHGGSPTVNRTILVGGAGVPASFAEVGIGASNRLQLMVAGAAFGNGTVSYGTEVVPIFLKLDVTNLQQKVFTDRETITAAYTTMSSARGIFLGGAYNGAPDGRWLYMAAWYGSHGEISDSEVDKMITALGF